jgi:hypothetical protein
VNGSSTAEPMLSTVMLCGKTLSLFPSPRQGQEPIYGQGPVVKVICNNTLLFKYLEEKTFGSPLLKPTKCDTPDNPVFEQQSALRNQTFSPQTGHGNMFRFSCLHVLHRQWFKLEFGSILQHSGSGFLSPIELRVLAANRNADRGSPNLLKHKFSIDFNPALSESQCVAFRPPWQVNCLSICA